MTYFSSKNAQDFPPTKKHRILDGCVDMYLQRSSCYSEYNLSVKDSFCEGFVGVLTDDCLSRSAVYLISEGVLMSAICS